MTIIRDLILEQKCTGCSACVNICPQSCIVMKENAEGFLYPQIDNNTCIHCNLCEKVCPVAESIGTDLSMENAKVFACVNKNHFEVHNSSSGGIFSLLAGWVMQHGGIVFGATFDKHFEVCHTYVENLDDLSQFRGSKYVQSNLQDNFKKVKYFLELKKLVLFSGAPCQIAGLLKYLGKNYSNLITCDFICTGVPSPKIFRSYKTFVQSQLGESITQISFRNKTYGWEFFSMSLKGDSKKYQRIRFLDSYILGQYEHITLRPSCYQCQFKKCNSNSDIKLADYWYVRKVHPEIYYKDGTSLIIINTEKAYKIFNELIPFMNIAKSSIENVIKTNASFSVAVSEPEARKQYLEVVQNTNDPIKIVNILQKLTKRSFKQKVMIYLRMYKNMLFG